MKQNLSSEIFKELSEIICVGFPFASFKIIFGQYLCINLHSMIGYVVIIWGVLDLLINGINFFYILLFKRRWQKTCFLNFVAGVLLRISRYTHEGPKDLGTALDVLLSFVIVALVIGLNYFAEFSPLQQKIWSIGVILNVLSAGFNRLLYSTKRLKRKN